MKNVLLTIMLCLLAGPNLLPAADAAPVIDPASVSGEGEVSLNDSLALPPDETEQEQAVTVTGLGSDSFSLETSDASMTLEYELIDDFATGGDHARMSLTADGGGGDLSSGSATLTLTFTTNETLQFSFSPVFHPFAHTTASLDGMEVERFYDRFDPDLEGGNYLTDEWLREGVLEAGEHTLSFTFFGSGYRGAAWGQDSSVALELTRLNEEVTAMPEPTSAALLGIAMATLLRRRRNRHAPIIHI